MGKVSNFSKQQILDCYGMMIKFVSGKEEILLQELYTLEAKIAKRRISIPKDIYDKIISFVDVNLAPLIDERRYHWCTEEECGQYDHDGNFVQMTYEQKRNYDERRLELFYERLRLVEEFGMRELYPVLTNDEPVSVGLDNTVYNSRKWVKYGVRFDNRRV